jgi:phage gp36-like protein
MAYATIGDIFARYAPIHTMVGTGTQDVTSLEVSSIFIADAESFMNTFLAKRYSTPVATEPVITMIAADLAISNMMFEKLGELPNFIQPRYDRAMMMLEKLANGDLILTSNSTSIVTTGDNFAWSTTINYHNIFSPVLDELDQAADKDQIDADKDERVGDYSNTAS